MNIVAYIGIGVVSLIIIELIVSHRRKFKTYTLSDSIVNLSCGMIERLFNFFVIVLSYFAYEYLFEHFSLFQLPVAWYTWLLAIVVADFLSYWFHRLSHEINFLWAAHIVHHQSEELNITTVFRVSFFAVIYRFFFFMWMPVFGFAPELVVGSTVFIGIFQFLTHSRLVGKLGPLEWFFTTPSHHRVHHARNDKYIDQNYSHVMIIWDRIFGTFTEEQEEPDYGITSGFESVNPFWAQFSYWDNLIIRARKAKSFKSVWKLFTGPPTWTPEESGFVPDEYSVDEKGNRKLFRHILDPERGAYLLIGTLMTFAAFLTVISLKMNMEVNGISDLLTNAKILTLVLLILWSIFVHGRFMEGRRSATWLEMTRVLALLGVVIYWFADSPAGVWLVPALAAASIIQLGWLIRLSRMGQNDQQVA